MQLKEFALKQDQQDAVMAVCRMASDSGGRALLVGGCVRDTLLGRPANDVDIEIFGVPAEKVQSMLSARFRVGLVGAAFGVIKLLDHPIDVSLPRRESKAGLGHRGFHIQSDPDMTFRDAASRRDFTMNAMGFDPVAEKLLDPFDGRSDLARGELRHVSDKFVEDPLRVLRGMQFAARFDMAAAPETIRFCRTIQPENLAQERIFEEWKKLVLKGLRPSRGLGFLKDAGWLGHYPELAALDGCEQEPRWHPEGDVWVHTLHCMDAFADARSGVEDEDLAVGLAVLCHDLGKPMTTVFERGRIRSPRHDIAGEAPARAFLGRMTRQQDLIDRVAVLVTHHLRPLQLFQAKAHDGAIRRLARQVGRIDLLVRVAEADHRGRPGLAWDGFPSGRWLLDKAEELRIRDAVPKPIVMGRHLIEMGLTPGPEFGRILAQCYERQLDGDFSTLDEGIAYACQVCGKDAE